MLTDFKTNKTNSTFALADIHISQCHRLKQLALKLYHAYVGIPLSLAFAKKIKGISNSSKTATFQSNFFIKTIAIIKVIFILYYALKAKGCLKVLHSGTSNPVPNIVHLARIYTTLIGQNSKIR